MKRKTKIKSGNKTVPESIALLLLLFIAGISHQVMAQQITPFVICSGGETFTGNALSLDFTIGEITTESLPSAGVLLTQGFIQGADPNTGIKTQAVSDNDIKIYPNPVPDKVFIFYDNDKSVPVKVTVDDLPGRQIISLNYVQNPMPVPMKKLKAGFYTVSIFFNNGQKIIKKIIKQ